MSEGNPILNNPYREPERHYATNLEGELDYEKIEGGRRIFAGEIQTIPVPQRQQLSLVELNEFAAREITRAASCRRNGAVNSTNLMQGDRIET